MFALVLAAMLLLSGCTTIPNTNTTTNPETTAPTTVTATPTPAATHSPTSRSTPTETNADGNGTTTSPAEGTTSAEADRDGDGLTDGTEAAIGTDPESNDTDGDGRADKAEHDAPGLNPTTQDVSVIDGSPNAGLENAALRADARRSVEFLAALPQNQSQRDAVVVGAATEICDGHERVVADGVANASAVGNETYRNTYRVTHAARVMHALGADVQPAVIEQRMATARKFSGVAAKYTPVIGSYQRLHTASCGVKAGEPGAKEDFYIASAEFVVDLTLAQQQVVYKASFKTTGIIAQKTGLMRLARVCGYKCVGLVESETYWAVNGVYAGTLDHVAIESTNGNLTADEWNRSTRADVGEYLETTTDTTRINGNLIPNSVIVECIKQNIELRDLVTLGTELPDEARDVLRRVLQEGDVPANADLSFVERLDQVQTCTTH